LFLEKSGICAEVFDLCPKRGTPKKKNNTCQEKGIPGIHGHEVLLILYFSIYVKIENNLPL
jgi:hypothetical protein